MADLWCFDVHGGIGKAALYKVPDSDPTDDAPLTAPRSHLSRVRFHTDFKYPKIVSDTTYTVTLPDRAHNTRGEATYILGAHGRGGVPFCFGTVSWTQSKISVANTSYTTSKTFTLPLFISTPVNTLLSSSGPDSWEGRMLSLGADSTNLLVHEFAVQRYASGTTFLSRTYDVRVLVTDELL